MSLLGGGSVPVCSIHSSAHFLAACCFESGAPSAGMVSSGGRLFVVDALAGSATVLRDSGLLRLVAMPDGVFYTLLRPAGESNLTHLAAYTPPPDPCPASDLRPHVWTGEVDSGVRNRFTDHGCTIADRLPPASATWPNHQAYVSAVVRAVRDLLARRAITPWEAALVVAAAVRSCVGTAARCHREG